MMSLKPPLFVRKMYICPICKKEFKKKGHHLSKHGVKYPVCGAFSKEHAPWNKGIKMPNEFRESCKQGHLGLKLSEEHKKNISKSCKGLNAGEKNGQYGDKYIRSKLKLCPFCGEKIYARGFKEHQYKHYTTPERAARNKQISNSLEKHWENLFDLGQFERRERLYPKGWTSNLREFIRNSYFRLCFDCGAVEIEKHHIHHVDWDKKNLSPSNLIPLCRSCHAKRHRRGIKTI